jgi:hypothetical protein
LFPQRTRSPPAQSQQQQAQLTGTTGGGLFTFESYAQIYEQQVRAADSVTRAVVAALDLHAQHERIRSLEAMEERVKALEMSLRAKHDELDRMLDEVSQLRNRVLNFQGVNNNNDNENNSGG